MSGSGMSTSGNNLVGKNLKHVFNRHPARRMRHIASRPADPIKTKASMNRASSGLKIIPALGTLLVLLQVIPRIFGSGAAAAAPAEGAPAPAFQVTAGDGQVMALDQLKGKTAIIMYETRETVEQNRAAKNALAELLAREAGGRAGPAVVPVINCSSAVWPLTRIWQANLRRNSAKEGLTIYGDWDGRMAADYGMRPEASNILLIDRQSIIRFFRSGPLDSADLAILQYLLQHLAR